MVDGTAISRKALVQDIRADKATDLDFIVGFVDWDRNVDTHFKDRHYIEPIVATGSHDKGYIDRWIVYGVIYGEHKFSVKELTVQPVQVHAQGQRGERRHRGARAWADW